MLYDPFWHCEGLVGSWNALANDDSLSLSHSLSTQGNAKSRGKRRCRTSKHIGETSVIEDKNGSPISITS